MIGDSRSRRKTPGSYPYFGVLFSITLALFLISLFGALVIYADELGRLARENVRIQVFLKNQLEKKKVDEIEKKLKKAAYSLKGKKEAVEFVSKEVAAKKFIQETGENFHAFMGENPLRDAFLVTLDPAWQDKSKLESIRKDLEKTEGIHQVYYVEELIVSVNRNVANIGLVLLGLASILLLAVVLLINSTLRLALFSQRFLIRSMQLVGATRFFIQTPFLLRSAFIGAIAGLLAVGGLWAVLTFATRRVADLALLENRERLYLLVASIIAMGIFVAVVSTWRAVSRYLRLSLDELY